MRERYYQILKTFFSENVVRCRGQLGISQEEMAHRLVMSVRTYSDIELGKSCCGALTLSLFLIYICVDSKLFLAELQNAFENNDKKIA